MKPGQRAISLARGMVLPSLLVAGLLTLTSPAGAQTIWRCDGGSRYSDRPCAEGTKLATDAAPDADRQMAAAAVAQRQIALAERLRAERHAREAAYQAALLPPKPRPAPRQRPRARDAQGLPPAMLSARPDRALKSAQRQAEQPASRESRRVRVPAADDRTSPATARASR